MRGPTQFVRLLVLPIATLALEALVIQSVMAEAMKPPSVVAPAQSSQTSTAAPTPQPTGLILGRVLDAGSNDPVPDAVVTIAGGTLGRGAGASSGAAPTRIVVDEQGRFFFRDLAKGSYTLTVTAPGYAAGGYGATRPGGPPRPLDLADGEKRGDVAIHLWKQGRISGTVTDEKGEPMIGIPIRAITKPSASGGVSYLQTEMTDDRGVYQFDVVPGDYLVAVVNSVTTMPSTVGAEHEQALSQGAISAYDETARAAGAPTLVQGVRVGDLVMGTGDATGGMLVPSLQIDSHRVFVYPSTIYPASRTSADATAISVGSGERKTGIDLRLRPQPTYRVSGSVIGPDGFIPKVGVRLAVAGPTSSTVIDTLADSFQTATDVKGDFTFLGVVPGQYTLRVLKTPLVGSQSTTISVTTPNGGSVTSISRSGANAEPVSAEATLWAAQQVTVGDADMTDVTVAVRAGARVNGRVEYAANSQELDVDKFKALSIGLRVAGGATALLMNNNPSGRIEENRQFTTPQAVPGKYFITVSALPATTLVNGVPHGWVLKSAMVAGKDAADLPIDIESSDVDDVIIMLSDRVSKLSGVVRGADGKIATSASVVVFPVDSTLWPKDSTPSRRLRTIIAGLDGTYSITGMPAGDYFVVATSSAVNVDLKDSKFLMSLTGVATRVSLGDGEIKTQDVRVSEIK